MSERREGVVRLLAFLWAMTVAAFVSGIVTFVGMIWGAIDVLWQIATGRNDLKETSTPARVVKGTLLWNVNLLIFSFTGDGSMEWLPSW